MKKFQNIMFVYCGLRNIDKSIYRAQKILIMTKTKIVFYSPRIIINMYDKFLSRLWFTHIFVFNYVKCMQRLVIKVFKAYFSALPH